MRPMRPIALSPGAEPSLFRGARTRSLAGIGTGAEPRIRVSRQLDETDVLSPVRRRVGKLRRSRRSLLRRSIKPFLAALAIVGAPTAMVAWMMTSPRFALRELSISTGERVPQAWVRQALGPLAGENLPLLPLARAERLLHAHPWVLGADLRKDLPGRLAVRVTEKQAVALLRDGTDLYWVDADGTRIARFDPAAPATDLPLLSLTDLRIERAADEAAALRAAVRLLAEIEEVEPTWAAGLSEIEVLGEEDFRIYTATLAVPVLVRTGTLNHQARRLEELLPHIVERYGAAAAIDLRFARRIIVQPSVASGGRPSGPSPATTKRKATADHAQRG